MRSGFLGAVVLVWALLSATPARASSPDPSADAPRAGAATYAKLCAACHGREGRGDGPGARELDPRPRDFTLGRFRFRSTPSGEVPRRSDVESVIRRGRAGTAMPSFGGLLSDGEIADVATLVLSMGPRGLPDRDPAAMPMPPFPPASSTDLADGRAVYLALGCWKCHGADGSGRGPSAPKLRTDEDRPIRPRDFRYEPFRGGRSLETVARAVLSGLIGTPMPSHAEILVIPREAVDAVAPSLPEPVRADLDGFRVDAPSAQDVQDMDDAAWEELRNRNLSSLAQYVLSLSRRDRWTFRLFRENPESEGRVP